MSCPPISTIIKASPHSDTCPKNATLTNREGQFVSVVGDAPQLTGKEGGPRASIPDPAALITLCPVFPRNVNFSSDHQMGVFQ